MKKIISYICVICLMLSCISFVFASADDISSLSISSSTAKAGEEVEVVLSVSSTSAIVGLECEIEYNSDAMTLTSVTIPDDSLFPAETFQGSESYSANPYYVSWDNSLEEAVTATGDLAILKFKISESAYNGEYAVTPVFTSGGAFDGELNDVDFTAVSGCITVTDGIEPETPITTPTTTLAGATTATTTTTVATTTTTTTTTTAPANQNILYSWEENADALTATNTTASRVTDYANDGEYSIKLVGKTGVWDRIGNYVTSSYFKNYVTITIPSGLDVTGNVGFYAYTTSSNSSNYEAYGVKMADGTYYFTKFANHLSNSWKAYNITKITLYKLDDSSTTITLDSSNFSDTAEDGARVAGIVFIDAGTTDTTTPTYIDQVYFESDSQISPTSSSSTTSTTTTAKPAVDGELELTSNQVNFVNCKWFAGTCVAGSTESGYIAKMQGGTWSGSDKFFGIKFDQSVYDLNPIKFEITLKTDGGNYSGNNSWFSTVDYTTLQSQPAVQSTIPRVNTGATTVSTTGTTFTFDLTSDSYKDIVTNKYNYYYLCASKTNSSVTNMYCVSFKVYYSTDSYALTIDGQQQELSDNSFTFPTTADLYIGNDSVYNAGEIITVDKDMSFTSYSLNLTMQACASIRLNEKNGLRFYTDVNIDVMNSLASSGATVAQGTLITPADLLGETELTFENDVKKIDVAYDGALGSYYNQNGFVGSIVNIKESNDYNETSGNITRPFVARGYVTVTLNGVSKTVYAENYKTSRSIAYVAYYYKNDDTSDYNSLSAEKTALVDKWAAYFIEN